MAFKPAVGQGQIARAARNYLAREAPIERFRTHGHRNRDARLWPDLGDHGFLGLGVATEYGGAGLGAAEECLLYRELGRQLISPAILGLTLSARLAARSGDRIRAKTFLFGQVRVGLARLSGPGSAGPVCVGAFELLECSGASWAVVWSPDGAGFVRTGDFTDVEDAECVDGRLGLEVGRLNSVGAYSWLASDEEPIGDRALLLIAAYQTGLAEAAAGPDGEPPSAWRLVERAARALDVGKTEASDQTLAAAIDATRAMHAATSANGESDPANLFRDRGKVMAVLAASGGMSLRTRRA